MIAHFMKFKLMYFFSTVYPIPSLYLYSISCMATFPTSFHRVFSLSVFPFFPHRLRSEVAMEEKHRVTGELFSKSKNEMPSTATTACLQSYIRDNSQYGTYWTVSNHICQRHSFIFEPKIPPLRSIAFSTRYKSNSSSPRGLAVRNLRPCITSPLLQHDKQDWPLTS